MSRLKFRLVLLIMLLLCISFAWTACRAYGGFRDDVVVESAEDSICDHVLTDDDPITEGYADTGNTRPSGPVPLIVFMYDDCGGCGAGMQGCGTCDEMDRLHLIILSQFGNRLHDGSIVYRLFNVRDPIHEETRMKRVLDFNVPEEYHRLLPIAFIGTEYDGLFMASFDLMPYVQEIFDRYVAGEAVYELQREVLQMMEDLCP